MKQLVKNYSFNATTRQITLSDYSSVLLERLQLIVNTTNNTILYNFVDNTLSTAAVSSNVITLSTVGSSVSTDKLQIIYDSALNDPIYDTTYIADGQDVTLGTTTDAAVTTDHNGTISGKLRGLVSIFNDIWDSTNHVLKVTLASGLSQALDSVLTYPRGSNAISITASSLILTGAGKLNGIFVSSSIVGTIKVWDSTAASGTVHINTFAITDGTMYTFPNGRVSTGIYVTITGTANITVYYDPTVT